MMQPQAASETAPLLVKPTTALPDPSLSPNSVPPCEVRATAHRNEDAKTAGDEERQDNDENRGHQYEGMPDMKAKLGYIVPAVGIGVRPSSSEM